MDGSAAVLQAIGLRKSFDRTRALDGLDLSVTEGEVLALLGPTGAGKTTTLRTLAGLEAPDAGQVLLDGRDVTADSPRARDLAVVFEGFNLLPTLPVRENIAFPLRSPVYREAEEVVARRVDAAASDLKIGHLLDRSVNQLSGGERQRVAIARALVRRPRAFLMDEPLSALDLKLREALQAELKLMHEKYGATVVYASHDFPSAAALADRLALIEDGRVLQTGTLAELIADPRSASVGRLVGSPSMALFEGAVTEGVFRLKGLEARVAAPGTCEGPALLGIWPEDIEIADAPAAIEGRIWATDFRGADRAVEVHFGPHRFRKAVPRAMIARQGDAIRFTLPPERCFLFDAQTGARLDGASLQDARAAERAQA